jgi:serine/threonine protein kinase
LEYVKSINNDHLIKHLAICEEAQCIFFPWANGGSLWDFWEFHGPEELERTANVLRWSLQQLTGITEAMAKLYPENFRHGDLKPSNILHFTEGGVKLGTLKIADLGVSRVHEKGAWTDLRAGFTTTTASTPTYQGPEAHETYRTKGARSRKYDSWSIGCIILEFIVWLLYDSEALMSFKRARDESSGSDNPFYRLIDGSDPKKEDIEKAIEVRPSVNEAIGKLKSDDRCRDTALGALVGLVESNLLKIVPKKRLESIELYGELKKILEYAEDLSYLVNEAKPPSSIPEIFNRPPSPQSDPQSTHGQP